MLEPKFLMANLKIKNASEIESQTLQLLEEVIEFMSFYKNEKTTVVFSSYCLCVEGEWCLQNYIGYVTNRSDKNDLELILKRNLNISAATYNLAILDNNNNCFCISRYRKQAEKEIITKVLRKQNQDLQKQKIRTNKEKNPLVKSMKVHMRDHAISEATLKARIEHFNC